MHNAFISELFILGRTEEALPQRQVVESVTQSFRERPCPGSRSHFRFGTSGGGGEAEAGIQDARPLGQGTSPSILLVWFLFLSAPFLLFFHPIPFPVCSRLTWVTQTGLLNRSLIGSMGKVS